jgi:hypothetical protein
MWGSPGSSLLMLRPALLLLLPVALHGACRSAASLNERSIDNVVNRAQFDLDCPREQLRLAPLQYEGDVVTSYGVIGCGRRGAYVRTGRNTFILDQNRTQTGAATPPAPPPNAPPSK